MDNQKEELFLDFSEIQFHKLLLTLKPFVLEKKVLENLERIFISKNLLSTELSQGSWPKEEISQWEMEEVENPSMVKSSRMRTSKLNTPNHTFYLWLTPDQTLMDLNSLSLSLPPHGSMVDTSFSEKFLKVKKLSKLLRPLDLKVERPPRRQSSLIQVLLMVENLEKNSYHILLYDTN